MKEGQWGIVREGERSEGEREELEIERERSEVSESQTLRYMLEI